MITGIVQANEGRIHLRVRGPHGRKRAIVAVIDTGYSEWLTLPSETIADLELRFRSLDSGTLADGSECIFEVYAGAKVEWNGAERPVVVEMADADPLVGMKLLKGYELKMQVRPRGKITIKRLGRS